LRLRYEITRELAPYIGFVWERKVGRTADLARGLGEEFDTPAFVVGMRFWF
jgi:copper resistance protein B